MSVGQLCDHHLRHKEPLFVVLVNPAPSIEKRTEFHSLFFSMLFLSPSPLRTGLTPQKFTAEWVLLRGTQNHLLAKDTRLWSCNHRTWLAERRKNVDSCWNWVQTQHKWHFCKRFGHRIRWQSRRQNRRDDKIKGMITDDVEEPSWDSGCPVTGKICVEEQNSFAMKGQNKCAIICSILFGSFCPKNQSNPWRWWQKQLWWWGRQTAVTQTTNNVCTVFIGMNGSCVFFFVPVPGPLPCLPCTWFQDCGAKHTGNHTLRCPMFEVASRERCNTRVHLIEQRPITKFWCQWVSTCQVSTKIKSSSTITLHQEDAALTNKANVLSEARLAC